MAKHQWTKKTPFPRVPDATENQVGDGVISEGRVRERGCHDPEPKSIWESSLIRLKSRSWKKSPILLLLEQLLSLETSVMNNQINNWGRFKYTQKKIVVFVTLKLIVLVLNEYNYWHYTQDFSIWSSFTRHFRGGGRSTRVHAPHILIDDHDTI